MTAVRVAPSRAPGTRGRGRSRSWSIPAALVALGAIPVVAGSVRLVELAGGPERLPARVDPSPIPLVAHIVSVIVFAILGAFQFSAALRRRRSRWHRVAGRVVVVAGLVVALSALWLTVFHPQGEGGALLFGFRLLAGSGMAMCLVLGFTAIRRRDVVRHRAWMTRAYAVALGAGTQVFTLGVGEAVVGTGDRSTALLHAAGWAINLAVAERVLHRRVARTRAVVTSR